MVGRRLSERSFSTKSLNSHYFLVLTRNDIERILTTIITQVNEQNHLTFHVENKPHKIEKSQKRDRPFKKMMLVSWVTCKSLLWTVDWFQVEIYGIFQTSGCEIFKIYYKWSIFIKKVLWKIANWGCSRQVKIGRFLPIFDIFYFLQKAGELAKFWLWKMDA